MLTLAQVKPDEKVYDLGSGDGRIALTAGREFQARAVGIEINPFLVGLARLKVVAAGLGGSVETCGKISISKASAMQMWLPSISPRGEMSD